MPRIAFVFPGQGAQYQGMGKDLAENFAEAAQVFSEADQIAGYKLSTLCYEDPDDLINQTEYAQPALLTTSLAILAVAKKHGINPDMYAGLSLGEYTALVAAGCISFRDALPLVQKRASLMQSAVPADKGGMAAVIGMNDEQVKKACIEAGGIVDIANYNAPGQVVISGEKEAVDKAALILKGDGARVIPLAVSVPSHCQLMYDAAMQLKPYLEEVEWQEPQVEVISNVNAKSNSAAQYAELLVKQLYCPVLWEQSVRYMMDKVDYFIEIGPGSSLTSLIKRIERKKILGNIEDTKSLNKVIEKVNKL